VARLEWLALQEALLGEMFGFYKIFIFFLFVLNRWAILCRKRLFLLLSSF
jgi:hypothetical protein